MVGDILVGDGKSVWLDELYGTIVTLEGEVYFQKMTTSQVCFNSHDMMVHTAVFKRFLAILCF